MSITDDNNNNNNNNKNKEQKIKEYNENTQDILIKIRDLYMKETQMVGFLESQFIDIDERILYYRQLSRIYQQLTDLHYSIVENLNTLKQVIEKE